LANIQSQKKRNRQNEKRRLRNRDFRGAARSAVRDALTAIESGQESQAAVAAAVRKLDKAAQKGAVHQRNAARRKSRLVKRLMAAGQALVTASPVVKKAAPKTVAEPKPKKTATRKAVRKPPAKKTTKK